jgi:nitrogenase molybdenum-iron protein alpha/beta subunit
MRHPFSIGAYLAANAVSDAVLVVDGPDCMLLKGEVVHGNHDWCSTLLGTPSHPRLVHTDADAETVSHDRTGFLVETLRGVDARPDVGVTLIVGTPVSQLTGIQYDLLIRRLGATRAPLAEVAYSSLDSDWLDGYAAALNGLVDAVLCARAASREQGLLPGTAAVVGLMTDRVEGDCLGNAGEIRRLLEEGCGLKVLAVLPDGGPLAGLTPATRAEVLVSLPYGRQAAQRLARATGARLVEACLPCGLEATRELVRAVAEAVGAQARAAAFLERETREVVRRLRFFGPRRLQRSLGAWLGDPFLAPGVTELLTDLGCRVEVVAATARAAHAGRDTAPRGTCAWDLLWEPQREELAERIIASRGRAERFFGVVPPELDLERRFAPMPCTLSELGFPSLNTHAAADRPYLGFRGVLPLVERLGGLDGRMSPF